MEADTRRMRTTTKGLKSFVTTNLKTLAGLAGLAGLADVVASIEARAMLIDA